MKCPYCNNDIPNKSKKCEICGVDLTKEKDNDQNIDRAINIIVQGGGILSGIVEIAFGLIMSIGISTSLLNTMFVPAWGFVIIGLSIIGKGIGDLLMAIGKNDIGKKIDDYACKGITLGFVFFIFGFLILADIDIFKSFPINEAIPVFLFTLLFWVFAIILLIRALKK
jgi:hypothetical protein